MRRWSFKPPRIFGRDWRISGRRIARIHPALSVAWYVLSAPFLVLATLGAIFCVLLFPATMLNVAVGNDNEVGPMWIAWAAIVLGFWSIIFLVVCISTLQHLRLRIVHLGLVGMIVLMSLSYVIAFVLTTSKLAADS